MTALCYRNAKAYDKSRAAYERAAEVHYKNAAYPINITTIHVYSVLVVTIVTLGELSLTLLLFPSIFQAGRSMEQAAHVAKV